MPHPSQSIAPSALPPRVDPTEWEETFRETLLLLLLWCANPAVNAALRRFGVLLFDLILGSSSFAPDVPNLTRAELAAVAGDLRHLEGFLRMVGATGDATGEPRLCAVAERQSRNVARIAAAIEGALAPQTGVA